MTAKEHLVRCDLQEFYWVRDSHSTEVVLSVDAQAMWLYLRRRNRMSAVKGPVLAKKREMGGISVEITLLSADMNETDKVYHGSIADGFWNPDPGSPGIIFEDDLGEDKTYNGVLRPYNDGFDDEKFLHEPTTIDPTDDTLPPDFFS